MRKKNLVLALIYLLLVTTLSLIAVSICSAQSSQPLGLSITYNEYGWSKGMKENNPVTDPYIGLVFMITIANNGSQQLILTSGITVYVNVQSTIPNQLGSLSNVFSGDLTFPDINLVPGQSQSNSLNVTSDALNSPYPYESLPIGTYSAQLTYSIGQPYQYYGSPLQILPYPFNFRVVSPSELQSAIQQNEETSGTTVNLSFPIQINLFDSGAIVVTVTSVIGVVIAYRKSHKKHKTH